MQKKPTSRAALVERRQAYYQVIYAEEGERFGAALRLLYETIFPELATPPAKKRSSRIPTRTLATARRLASSRAHRRLETIRARDKRGFTVEDHARVKAFVYEWRLPRTAEQDVWESFFRAQYDDAPPRLIALLPPSQHPPKRPITPPSFLYDPLCLSLRRRSPPRAPVASGAAAKSSSLGRRRDAVRLERRRLEVGPTTRAPPRCWPCAARGFEPVS